GSRARGRAARRRRPGSRPPRPPGAPSARAGPTGRRARPGRRATGPAPASLARVSGEPTAGGAIARAATARAAGKVARAATPGGGKTAGGPARRATERAPARILPRDASQGRGRPRARAAAGAWSCPLWAAPSAPPRGLHPGAVRRHAAGPDDFSAAARGLTITGACRRGKYLWLPVVERTYGAPSVAEDALLAHLGMSGQLLLGDPGRPVSPHVRVRFTFTDSGPDLRFTDQRTFGHLAFAPGGAVLPPMIPHIPPDPMHPRFAHPAATA